jgi:TrmH family RNA methyltransferase
MARRFPSPNDSTKAPRKSANLTEARADAITSRDNKWLKKFRAALQGTGPTGGEPIGVEGTKLVEEAVRSGLEVEALLVSDLGERELEGILLAARETEAGIPRSRILRTTDKLFAGVAGTETPQGVAALVQARAWEFDDLLRGRADVNGAFCGDAPLVVVMAGVQDPGNVGTIVRSAEAFGATGVVAARGTADPWSPKALRASAGSALRLPLVRGMAVPILIAQLRMAHVKIFAAITKSAGALPAADLREPAAILIGSEGAGLAPEIERSADARISIPMSETVESLNAGVAASVLLFEAARQRRKIGITDEHR